MDLFFYYCNFILQSACQKCGNKLKPSDESPNPAADSKHSDAPKKHKTAEPDKKEKPKAKIAEPDPQTIGRRPTDSPGKIVVDEIKHILSGIKKLFTFKGSAKKLMIAAGTLILTWLVTILVQKICADKWDTPPFVLKMLTFLSFANGGLSNEPFHMVGGLFGKTLFASSLLSLIFGGFKPPIKGVPETFKTMKKLSDLSLLPTILCGAGSAMILYNFFCGKADISLCMVGISGIVTLLGAIGGRKGFAKKIAVSLTADVDKEMALW